MAVKGRVARWQWNEAEDAALDSVPNARAQLLYLRGIRRFMDYATGLAGVRRKFSYQYFTELMEENRPRGSTHPNYRPTLDEIRYWLKLLEEAGLIVVQPKARRTDPMVFLLPLATSDLVRLNEEPQRSPIKATPKPNPATARGGGVANPTGTPKDEPHTSEGPLIDKSTNVDLLSKSRCPHKEILSIWGEVMPPGVARPLPSMWNGVRRKNLAARWADGFLLVKRDGSDVFYRTPADGLVWWRAFFMHVAKKRYFVNGEWAFSLGWLIKPGNFQKVVEGGHK